MVSTTDLVSRPSWLEKCLTCLASVAMGDEGPSSCPFGPSKSFIALILNFSGWLCLPAIKSSSLLTLISAYYFLREGPRGSRSACLLRSLRLALEYPWAIYPLVYPLLTKTGIAHHYLLSKGWSDYQILHSLARIRSSPAVKPWFQKYHSKKASTK